MKKRGLSALALGSALVLLCGCGGGTPALNFSANWYSNTTDEKIQGTYEHLEYAITLNPAEGSYGVRYESGTFVTELSGENYEGYGTVYKLTATRNITGKYHYESTESETFEDRTYSEVYFTGVKNGLRPIYSKVEMHTSIPASAPSATNLFTRYSYTYETTYDASLENAHFVLQYYDKEGKETQKIEEDVELDDEGTYLDNEQILFALRGVSLSGSIAFHSIDPQTRLDTSVALTQTPTAVTRRINCEIDGVQKEEDVTAMQISLGYSSTQAGPSRTLIYAAKGDAANNTYRNALLYFDYSVQQIGTICYTLKKATFAVN